MYKEIITKSLKDVFDNYEGLFKSLLIPTALLFIIEYFSVNYIGVNKLSILNILLLVLSLLINMVILITVHRVLILGSDSVPTWGLKSYTKREFTFLLKYLAMIFGVVFLIFMVVLILNQSTLLYFVLPVLFIAICIVISRLSLVFPSISIDENMSFFDSWEYTKNYKLLVFTTIIVFPLIFSLIVGGIYALIIGFLASVVSSGLSILMILLNVVISVFLVSALSNTYMYIIYHSENNDNESKDDTYDQN